jgi:hypothetical protein
MRTDLSLQDEDGWDLPPGHRDDVVVDLPLSFEPLGPAPKRGRGVLSADEINALLRPDLSDLPSTDEPVETAPRLLPDLSPPTPGVMASDEAVRRVCARLSLGLRQACGLMLAATPLAGSDEDFIAALDALPDERGRATLCFSNEAGEVAAMLVLSGALTSRLIGLACGAPPAAAAPAHTLTPLDADLLSQLLAPLSDAIAPGLVLSRVETESVFAAALALPGAARITDMMVRGANGQGAARLIVRTGEGTSESAAMPPVLASPDLPARGASGLVTVLTARVATLSVPLSALSDLKAGATLLLGVPSDQPLQILSGGRDGRVIAEGDIGRKGQAMAVKISRRVAG